MVEIKSRVSGLAAWIRNDILQLNFYRAHLIYFVISILVSSAVFWASNTDGYQVQYTDALFMCASAMTNCGLTTIDLSAVNAYQQTILFVLMALGDLSIASISVVWIRRYFFGRKIHNLLKRSKAARKLAEDIEEQKHQRHRQSAITTSSSSHSEVGRRKIQSLHDKKLVPTAISRRLPRTQSGYGGIPAPWETSTFEHLIKLPARLFKKHRASNPDYHYLSFRPQLDNRGRLHNLSSGQLEELGGVEYRALGVLTWLLPTYTMLWLSISWIVLLPYTTRPSTESIIRNAQAGSTNPRWWAFFAGLSAYSNTGLNLLDQNMIPFSHDYLILIITGAIVLGGNTFYPIFLRLFIWGLSKSTPKHSQLHHSLTFLLHHPRRCFLFLFPSKSTWYLFGIQVVIFMSVWLAFEVLNIGYAPIMSEISNPGQRTMDGLFQSVGVRSSGFYITNQSNLSPACQIYFMVNMYFSAIPFIVSLRSTNIYEERSIGKESNDNDNDDNDDADNDNKPGRRSQRSDHGPSVQTHLQNQLAYDLWWVILAVFLITIIERSPLADQTPGFTIFSIIFEVVSAYGTIGLSLGIPSINTSFCSAWYKLSKLILVTVMLRGRHRILPLAVDRAVLLPGQELMSRLDQQDMLGTSEYRRAVLMKYERTIGQEEEDVQAASASSEECAEHNVSVKKLMYDKKTNLGSDASIVSTDQTSKAE